MASAGSSRWTGFVIALLAGTLFGVGGTFGQFLFQHREAVLLGQTDGGRRFRFGGFGIPIPAPQIAFGRDQTLARIERGLKRGALIGSDHARQCEQAVERGRGLNIKVQRIGAVGQGDGGGQRPQIAPVARGGFIQRCLKIIA